MCKRAIGFLWVFIQTQLVGQGFCEALARKAAAEVQVGHVLLGSVLVAAALLGGNGLELELGRPEFRILVASPAMRFLRFLAFRVQW